jgi:hypothetical protein
MDRTFDREDDVESDDALANARPTGGRPDENGDAGSTTGTGTNEEFVGRTAGQDEGYAARPAPRRGPRPNGVPDPPPRQLLAVSSIRASTEERSVP